MSRAPHAAAFAGLLMLALALPFVAPAAGDPRQSPTIASCPATGCQPPQDAGGADRAVPPSGTEPQRENQGQADYMLFSLVVVLLVSIPIVVTWQRSADDGDPGATDVAAVQDAGPRLL